MASIGHSCSTAGVYKLRAPVVRSIELSTDTLNSVGSLTEVAACRHFLAQSVEMAHGFFFLENLCVEGLQYRLKS